MEVILDHVDSSAPTLRCHRRCDGRRPHTRQRPCCRTVRINQTNLGNDWFLQTLVDGAGAFVTGPATPPIGPGSFSMTTLTTNVDKATRRRRTGREIR